jgi:2'-5' RNA ligase
MQPHNGLEPINCFALVTYIPDRLGAFLDDLRRLLVPGCIPRAHVTILPPRPLMAPTGQAIKDLTRRIQEVPAFDIEAGPLEVFENTSVVYISLGKGREELHRLHSLLNSGSLRFDEPFLYHPHITVAQELAPEQVEELTEAARRRWAEYTGPRTFTAERITFVQSTVQQRWLDLAHWSLGQTVRR